MCACAFACRGLCERECEPNVRVCLRVCARICLCVRAYACVCVCVRLSRLPGMNHDYLLRLYMPERAAHEVLLRVNSAHTSVSAAKALTSSSVYATPTSWRQCK